MIKTINKINKIQIKNLVYINTRFSTLKEDVSNVMYKHFIIICFKKKFIFSIIYVRKQVISASQLNLAFFINNCHQFNRKFK